MDRRSAIPVIVALIVAIVGQAIILFGDFGPRNYPPNSGNGMITAAALARAGAVEIPTAPP
jgi:hypothetical protein